MLPCIDCRYVSLLSAWLLLPSLAMPLTVLLALPSTSRLLVALSFWSIVSSATGSLAAFLLKAVTAPPPPSQVFHKRVNMRQARRLQTMTLDIFEVSSSFEHDSPCVICLVDIKQGDLVLRMRCKHMCHKYCISRWLASGVERKCPLRFEFALDATQDGTGVDKC